MQPRFHEKQLNLRALLLGSLLLFGQSLTMTASWSRVPRARWRFIFGAPVTAFLLCLWLLRDGSPLAELFPAGSGTGPEAYRIRPDLARQIWDQWQSGLQVDGPLPFAVSGRVVVTGGGGNIGMQLVRRLLDSQVPVTSVDVAFVSEELEQMHRDIPEAKRLLRVVSGDIRDEQLLRSTLTPDVVGIINLAAVSRVLWCLENEKDCFDVNSRAVDELLEAMKVLPTMPWLVQASSREVYGSAETFPVTETAPRTPANAYGASKARAEEVIERHVAKRNSDRHMPSLQAIALRLANVYGGEYDHRERLVPSIMTQALSHRPIQLVGGHQDLDMIHIDDVVDAFLLTMSRLERRKEGLVGICAWFWCTKSQFEAFNIASGVSTPVSELLGKILSVTESNSPLQMLSGDNRFPDRYVGSHTKATAVLGFSPRVELDEGLHRLANAYLRRTADYLRGTIQQRCADRPKYTLADLTALDGCTGSVANAEMLPWTGYLAYDQHSGDFGWKDIVDPQSWMFEVRHGDGQEPIFRFRLADGSDATYLQVTEEIDGKQHNETRFKTLLDPSTGHVGLSSAFTGRPLWSDWADNQPTPFRLTPFCCPGKSAPWPFFAADPLAAAVLDHTTETSRNYTESRDKNLCEKLSAALGKADARLGRLAAYSTPYRIQQAPGPDGAPHEWRLRGRPVCQNLCDHPTVCVDTGSCMCAESACPARARFPFASTANLDVLSYPPGALDEAGLLDSNVLVEAVNRSTWLNVLRPHAARYLGRQPEFADIHLTRLPTDVQHDREENAEQYDKLASTPWGCFSADSALERGVKSIGKNYSSTSLVFLPNYSGTLGSRLPLVDHWLDNAKEHHLPVDFDEKNLVIPFTYDWGICNSFLYSLYNVRGDHAGPVRSIRRGTAWSVQGDLNSNCYRPDQDIVVPPRTCLQDDLRERFGKVEQVRPIRQRSNLITFNGGRVEAGHSVRDKISCPRPYADSASTKLAGASSLPSFWGRFPEHNDYLGTLNDTVFCPVPRGTTGWTTRAIDVIYAGCIPVLIGDRTHQAFWDSLDWAKFSITIDDSQLDRLEEVLMGYTWIELHQLQTNLMLVRDAFLYPTEGSEEAQWTMGPFYFAMHGSALLQQTRFPR